MNDYDEFKIWYTQKAPDESEVTMVDMAAMAWQAARAASPKVPQGVEEWISRNQFDAYGSDPWGGPSGYQTEAVPVSDLHAYLSGMAIVPVEPTDEMVDAGYGAMPDCKCTEGDKWRAKLVYKAMLAAAKENGE